MKFPNLALRILEGVLALAFIGAGASKLTASEEMVKAFTVLGAGQWFLYFTGGLEVMAGLALLRPAWSLLAAATLAAVMVCAVLAHWLILGGSGAPALVLLALLGVVIWQRWAPAARAVRA